MNDKAVYRTAPATPGLFISLSPWEIPWAPPSGFPSGSGYISQYIPPLVTIQIQLIVSLSVEETNKLRLKQGLKQLNTGVAVTVRYIDNVTLHLSLDYLTNCIYNI